MWFLSNITGVLALAIYPALFLSYSVSTFDSDYVQDGYFGWPRWIVAPVFYRVGFLLSLTGLRTVGDCLTFWAALVIIPFILFVCIGVFYIDPDKWVVQPDGGFYGVEWGPTMNYLFFGLNFWSMSSAVSGEIENINASFPAAMATTTWMVVLGYALVLLIAIGCTDYDNSEWGTPLIIANIAKEVTGDWLKYTLCAVCVLATAAQFLSNLQTLIYQMAGMADKGLIPAIFSQRNTNGVPIWTLLFTCVVGMGLTWLILDYGMITELMYMVNFFYSLTISILMVGFVKLRISHPEFHRPYAVPLPTWGVCIMILPPLGLTGLLFSFAPPKTWYICLPIAVFGMLLYWAKVYAEDAGWFAFVDVDQTIYPWMDDKGLLAVSDKDMGVESSSADRMSEEERKAYEKTEEKGNGGDLTAQVTEKA